MHATSNIVSASNRKRWTGASGFPHKDAAPGEEVISVKRILPDIPYITFDTAEKLGLQLNTEGDILPYKL